MNTLPALRRTLIGAAIALTASSSVWAQASPNPSSTARPESLSRLVQCRSITESTARLACYDSATEVLDAAERRGEVVVVDRAQVSAARRQLFGFELPSLPDMFERGPAIERVDSIESTLERASVVGEGRWLFRLADGGVWRQIDVEPVRFQNRNGQVVRVRRAALGSYLLTVGGSRAVRVRRQ